MSAVVSARSISRTEGVDPVRALQRVLYRSAKSNRNRRFHALFDKVARSDVMRAAWSVVAANRGAAGVDGQTIKDIEASGVGEFLDVLAAGVALAAAEAFAAAADAVAFLALARVDDLVAEVAAEGTLHAFSSSSLPVFPSCALPVFPS